MDKQVPAPPETPVLPPPEIRRPDVRPAPRRSRGWIWLLLLAIVIAGAWYWWPRFTAKPASGGDTGSATAPAAGGGGGRHGRGGFGGPVPVVAVRATKGNIGVYDTGLGNVTPIYTVTVKSRVDGELMKVYYNEGDIVHKGDPLAEIDPRPYQVALVQAEGNMAKDQATLDNARVDLKRYQTLLTQNAVPEQQLATQQATVKQDEGIVKSDEGAIESAKLNITYSHITAPITGLVGLRLVDPGNIVHASDSNGLVVITQIQPISVIFTLTEDELQTVLKKWRAGQRLRTDAYDRENKNKIGTGYLRTIDNQIDQSTGTVKLRADFQNEGFTLFPNGFVNAHLLVQEKTGITLLPTAAIQRNSQSTYVYLVKPDSTVTVRQIGLGTTEGDQTEITSGLKPGDAVVMTGVDKLVEGSKVVAHIDGETPPAGGGAPAGVGGAVGYTGHGGHGGHGGKGGGGKGQSPANPSGANPGGASK